MIARPDGTAVSLLFNILLSSEFQNPCIGLH